MKKIILPIGTIVKLIESDLKIIIIGHLMHDKNSTYIYDYCGCIYPVGITVKENLLYFNYSDIRNIVKMGYMDEETLKLHKQIQNYKDKNK